MTFQKIVVTIAIVFLVLALIAFGVALYNKKFKATYPPIIADCPDYWVDNEGTCINSKNLGKASCPKRFNIDAVERELGANAMCLKQQWAKACDLTWDGVTNYPDACINN